MKPKNSEKRCRKRDHFLDPFRGPRYGMVYGIGPALRASFRGRKTRRRVAPIPGPGGLAVLELE